MLYKILKSPAIVRKDRVIFERGSIKAKEVERLARKVAPSEMSVMILGPNGSGKEFVAHTVHKYSRRSDGPFVAVNCGGIPKELGVSEFFGHVKGAFTGANRNVSGYFESACGGTLFWMRSVICLMSYKHYYLGFCRSVHIVLSEVVGFMRRMSVL